MANENNEPKQGENNAQQRDTLLIAHVTAHLLDEESFELYPFLNENDVKSEVSGLVEGWAKSGFLLRGARMIPWHRVKMLEATSVEEVSRDEAQQRLIDWHAREEMEALKNFWKTKKEEKKDDGDSDEEEAKDDDKDMKGGGH